MSRVASLIKYIVVLALLVWMRAPATAADVDHALWRELLKEHVNYETGRVDYAAFNKNLEKLESYLNVLGSTDRSALSDNERKAFYINAYNSATIKLILESYPWQDSIRDIGDLFEDPFKKAVIPLEDDVYSLDDIEQDILRPEFQDARIHFALNCGAVSCPPLYDKPYVGAEVDEQLDLVTRNFINDPDRTWVEENTLYVTPIMDWYREDFEREGGILEFVKQYAEGDLQKKLSFLGSNVEIGFQDYDWSLNDMEE